MLQVIDVIHEQLRQGDFAAAANTAGRTLSLLGHAPSNMEQVGVVGPPEVDEVGPLSRLLVLDADPLLLLVAGEVLPVGNLAPHKALVVV